MTGRRVLGMCFAALLLAGAGALAAAGATNERPPTKLWSEFPLVPTTTSAAPATPPVSRVRQISRPVPATVGRVVQDADDTSLFLLAGIAFGFAAAGTAFAIVLFTGVQALRRRSWVEHTGEPEESPESPESPEPSAPRPVPASAASAAPPPPSATPVLVDVLQSSPRLSPAPQSAQQEELVVALWHGNVKSRFYATSTDPDGTETTVAASRSFRPERKLPVEESVAARAAHADLTSELAELGWEPVTSDETLASLFRRQSSATGVGGTASPDGPGRNQNA
jgi:hypothetical protein